MPNKITLKKRVQTLVEIKSYILNKYYTRGELEDKDNELVKHTKTR